MRAFIARRSSPFRISRLAGIAGLILLAVGLTQCVPTREVNIKYQPALRSAAQADPKLPPVAVVVLDKRRTQVVGHEAGLSGENAGDILPQDDPDEVLKNAFEIELRNEGLRIGEGGNTVVVALAFFQSQYLHPLFGTKIVASMGIDVTVRNAKGIVAYDSFILGQNQQDVEKHLEMTPHSASDALNAAMSDAVVKTFTDPAFLDALEHK